MPALSAYLLPQFRTGQAPVAQHNHAHVLRHRRGQFPQQFHYRVHPGPRFVGAQDAPGHGNRATAVDHADDDGGGIRSFQRRVNRQCQPTGTPPHKDPPEQRREAEAHVQFGLAGPGPVASVVQPLPEILAEVVPSAPGREGRRHGVLAGAASENSPADPQDQPGQLWPAEVGQMRFNHLLHLIAFPWKAHGRPPASGFVSATKMPDSRAFSKLSDQFQPLHTPISVLAGDISSWSGGRQSRGSSPALAGSAAREGVMHVIKPGEAPRWRGMPVSHGVVHGLLRRSPALAGNARLESG